MKQAKRSLAILLALCMTLSLLPATALATGDEDTAGVITDEVIVEEDKTDDAVRTEGDDEILDEGDDADETGDDEALTEGDEDADEVDVDQKDEEDLDQADDDQTDAEQTESDADQVADAPTVLAEVDEPAAQAEVDEPQVTVAGEMTYEKFLAAAVDGVITLDDDVTLTAGLPAVITTTVTVELSGRTLTIEGNGGFTVKNSGDLTIRGGDIVANGVTSVTAPVIDVQAGSSVTLESVTFNTSGTGVYPLGNAASVKVVDSTINAGAYAVSTNAKTVDNYGVEITLESSTFTGKSPVMINVPGTLTMTGCTVKGDMHGVIVRGGTAVITDCDISMSETTGGLAHYFDKEDWGTGNTVELAALTVGNKSSNSYQYPSNVTVSNTKLTSTDLYSAVAVYSNEGENKGVTLNIGDDCEINGAMKMGNAVASVGGKLFTTLFEAVSSNEAAKEEVVLLADVCESINVARDLILNLNGHTLAETPATAIRTQDTITVISGATLTIEGNGGTVDNKSNKKVAIYNSGTVVLNGGTYTRSAENGGDNSCYVLLNHGEMTINDAIVTVETSGKWYSAMVENGYQSYEGTNSRNNYVEGKNAAEPKLVINGGTFTGGNDLIKNDEGGVLEINDGTFTGTGNGPAGVVILNWNKATITGGTFTAQCNAVLFNGTFGPQATGELTITGGTFTAPEADGVFDTNNSNDEYKSDYQGISGGVFSSDVSDYCALGYKAELNSDGMYAIVEDASAVDAKIVKDGVTTYYETLQGAINAAQAGDTVTLLKDITTAAVLEVKESMTIDGGNHTITSTAGRLLWVDESNVEVTLKDIEFASATAERGVQVNMDMTGVTLNIDNCVIPATHYAINIGSNVTNLQLNINDSEITGWCALNLWGADYNVKVTNSTLNGINDKSYSAGGWNDFGVVVLEGDTTYKTDDHVENCSVELVDCTINAVSKTGNGQSVIVFNAQSKDNTVKISGDKTVVTYPENSELCLQNGTDNGLAVSAGTYSTAVPLECCAEGYLPVAKEGGFGVVADTLTLTPSVTSRRGAGAVTLTVAPAGLTCDVAVTCNDETIAVDGGANGTYTVSLPNQTATYTFTAALDDGRTAQCTVAVTRSSSYVPSTSGSSSSSGSGSSSSSTTTPVVDLGEVDVPLADKPFLFIDVEKDAWFYEAVKFASDEGLMKGVSDILFAPEESTTRGMVATILHRMESEPEATVTADFVDVESGSWYAEAMEWAAEVELVKGTGRTVKTAAPELNITREQLVTILYRYAVMKDMDVTARADLSGFADEAEVGAYAREAMEWAVSVGLIQGRGADRLAPLGETTRAELATILTRFKALPVPEAEGED